MKAGQYRLEPYIIHCNPGAIVNRTYIHTVMLNLTNKNILTVSGITCYQCNSGFDPRCGDPFDPYSLGTINCSLKMPPDHLSDTQAVLCRKTVQKGIDYLKIAMFIEYTLTQHNFISVYGKVRVIRECGYLTDEERDDKACVKRSGTHDVFALYCSCTTDLCNSGTHQLPNHIVMMASFLFAAGAAYFNLASNFNKQSL